MTWALASGSRGSVFALALATASVVGVVLESRALAQQGAPDASPARRVVEVQIAGAGADADAASLDDTMRELLGRLTLIMESQVVGHVDADEEAFRSTARPSLLARVGIDLRARDVAIVTVVDGRTGDITVRRSVRREGSPAVVREELAHVVQAAIDPMMLAERDRAKAAAALPPPPAPAPAPPAPPPVVAPPPEVAPPPATAPARDEHPGRDVAGNGSPGARSPLALDIATSAGVGSYASGAGLVPRAGGAATLVYRRGPRPSVGVSAHYLFPFDTGPQEALAHVGVTALRGSLGLEVFSSSSLAIDVAAGGGMDVLKVEPRSNVLPADRLGEATTRLSPVALVAVTGHLALGADTALSLTLGSDVDLTSRRWVLESEGGARSEAFAPSRVRLLAMLGFTFTALGDTRFASQEVQR